MIRNVRIENFKSIPDLSLDLGRVTVLIGANGSGKSNILEAIAMASAASQNKLDNEFLSPRGIRVTETRFMRSAYSKSSTPSESVRKNSKSTTKRKNNGQEPTRLSVRGDGEVAFGCELSADETVSYPKWKRVLTADNVDKILARLKNGSLDTKSLPSPFRQLIAEHLKDPLVQAGTLSGFLVFAPENSTLRTFQGEGQILPLGTKGEGLFAHLQWLDSGAHKDRLQEIKERLQLIDWFETFDIPANLSFGERTIRIRDRYLPEEIRFDQRSANEGFLFLLFYLTLLISPETPSFFAIDNIDTSLNPRLCIALLQLVITLAKEHDKQVILTTHNPALLDGLDLHDEEQRLLVVDRNQDGHTRVRRIDPPRPPPGKLPVSLSEAFMRGYIGGLPKNF